jgi:hypothetical protein
MEPIEIVRSKTGDKPKLLREVATGDSASTIFRVQYSPVLEDPVPFVWVSGAITAVTIDYEDGIFTFPVAPASDAEIIFQYHAVAYTDEEIQQFLAEGYGSTDLGAAKMLLAWAANAAKLAMRETLVGGGGTGSVTRDTSLTAQELRATAAALIDLYNKTGGTAFPVESITEVPWTEQVYNRQVDQDVIRNN